MRNSAVVQFNAPPSVVAGQAFSCSLTLQNTGTETWVPATTLDAATGFKLGSYPHDVLTWGPKRVLMPSSPVAPGATAVIVVSATAPQSPGPQQRMQWQMVSEAVEWFGAVADAFIDVLPAPPPQPIPLSLVLSPQRPDPLDPSSGVVLADNKMPCLFDSGAYVADNQWRRREFVNDTESVLEIAQAYLWTGIDLGGVCDTHVQMTLVDADGGQRLLHALQWDHYAQPTAPAGVFVSPTYSTTLRPDEVLRVDYYTQDMSGKHARHIANVWVLYR